MNIARCLETIDRLCSRPFPEEHGWSDVGRGGPGYFVAELGSGAGECGEHTADDVDAYREGIAQRLDDRWGAGPPWGMLTLRVRGERGEEIPEPWATVSVLADQVRLWRAVGTDRWVALGVTGEDGTHAARLFAVVTDMAPP
ncbi:hypothetical protein [Streptomyces sp. B93]|uniref:hypothetical protein n=1 Tax=Streptomyces sp. B93 TaxID=2824875 RepID=UPI001B359EA0|nr:hypothetical protein [Streptomyces sp. B93]MBQ1088717.1 hypothetical protein [Streptomyces sp. B93]